MFLEKYVSPFYYDQVLDNYEEFYLESLEEKNFFQIYNLFKKYDFYYIEDIILNYLEIFSLDKDEVEDKIIKLKNILGEHFVEIIGNDMRYLEKIIN